MTDQQRRRHYPGGRALPCPCCGGDDIASNEWAVDEDHANQFDADEYGEIWAFECSTCLASAPIQSWNQRADGAPQIHQPPEVPDEGRKMLMTYRTEDGTESEPVIATYHKDLAHQVRPAVRWIYVDELLSCQHDWASADNEAVTGGEICKRCFRVRAAQVTDEPEPQGEEL